MALSKPMETLATATAAGVGGMLATGILYPLDTIKTRIQSGSDSLFSELHDKKNDTKTKKLNALLNSMYQGLQYKMAQSSVSKFFYFYAYTALTHLVASKHGSPLSTPTTLLLGYLSELAHVPVSLPMESLATKMQTASAKDAQIGIVDVIRRTIRESGANGFYKGLNAHVVLCLQPAIQYTVFEQVKAMYVRRSKFGGQLTLGALEAFVLGAVARAVATLLLFPYIRAKVLAMSKQKDNAEKLENGQNEPPEKEGILSTMQQVVKEQGPLALYRGLGPELTRGALSSAIMLMIKEKLQTYITFVLLFASAQS